ncbi:MAG: HAD-IIA family hydrolase [Chloroflexi bacterium]|jgi:4-nitrophenyl phosphatase|nr:HAD-IIA family hydrolase [Chloroflexota bacterium]BCY18433.1 acid sugar phosphatase [Leptolinea sp. HRD-7]
MIHTLDPAIKGLILDMDGVLYKGNQPLGDLPRLFAGIKEKGWRVIMATNNAIRNTDEHLERMKSFGVDLEPWQIINSIQVVIALLKRRFPDGGPVYGVVSPATRAAIETAGYYFDEKDAQAVIVGLDRHVTYEKLETATLLIRSGKLFIGTNPDASFPTPRGEVPGAGSIIAAVSTATGVKPVFAGKPEPAMYEISMERLGTTLETTLAIGDRLDTDILGGQRAGCRTGLVMSGVTSPAELAGWEPKPDLVADDIWKLLDID